MFNMIFGSNIFWPASDGLKKLLFVNKLFNNLFGYSLIHITQNLFSFEVENEELL